MISDNKITREVLEQSIVQEDYYFLDDGVTTICQITLPNGFTVIGESACAHPDNFDVNKGKTYSKDRAMNKAWGFLGYELKTKLSKIADVGEPIGEITTHENTATYIGTKVIHATPMNRQEYNDLRGWQLPEDEDGTDEGYLVQYADNQESNLAGYTGYVSWSPKDIFDKTYETFI